MIGSSDANVADGSLAHVEYSGGQLTIQSTGYTGLAEVTIQGEDVTQFLAALYDECRIQFQLVVDPPFKSHIAAGEDTICTHRKHVPGSNVWNAGNSENVKNQTDDSQFAGNGRQRQNQTGEQTNQDSRDQSITNRRHLVRLTDTGRPDYARVPLAYYSKGILPAVNLCNQCASRATDMGLITPVDTPAVRPGARALPCPDSNCEKPVTVKDKQSDDYSIRHHAPCPYGNTTLGDGKLFPADYMVDHFSNWIGVMSHQPAYELDTNPLTHRPDSLVGETSLDFRPVILSEPQQRSVGIEEDSPAASFAVFVTYDGGHKGTEKFLIGYNTIASLLRTLSPIEDCLTSDSASSWNTGVKPPHTAYEEDNKLGRFVEATNPERIEMPPNRKLGQQTLGDNTQAVGSTSLRPLPYSGELPLRPDWTVRQSTRSREEQLPFSTEIDERPAPPQPATIRNLLEDVGINPSDTRFAVVGTEAAPLVPHLEDAGIEVVKISDPYQNYPTPEGVDQANWCPALIEYNFDSDDLTGFILARRYRSLGHTLHPLYDFLRMIATDAGVITIEPTDRPYIGDDGTDYTCGYPAGRTQKCYGLGLRTATNDGVTLARRTSSWKQRERIRIGRAVIQALWEISTEGPATKPAGYSQRVESEYRQFLASTSEELVASVPMKMSPADVDRALSRLDDTTLSLEDAANDEYMDQIEPEDGRWYEWPDPLPIDEARSPFMINGVGIYPSNQGETHRWLHDTAMSEEETIHMPFYERPETRQ